ncbi:MAG: hypothetical protein RL081_1453 [Pseudomonadota bacterium]
MEGQFAGLGLEHHTFGCHDVAQIPVLEGFIHFVANVLALDVDLDASRAAAKRRILQSAEAGLAHHPLEHHAAGDLGMCIDGG